MARVTINDIARLSGYSKTSVSFAFNDPKRISQKARDKILRIAEELGYIPDPVARNLSLRKYGTIGLLLPQVIPVAFQNPYLSQIVQGIGDVCEQEGYSLTIIPPIRESIIDGVRSAAVDGLITLGLEPGMQVVQIIQQRHMPFVTIDGRKGGDFPVVTIDDRSAAARVMRYVLSLGHRRVAILVFADDAEEESTSYSHVKRQRMEGYDEALSEVGLSIQHEDVNVVGCEVSLTGGREATDSLMDQGTLPTVIVAMSDIMAVGAIERLEQEGLRIPTDVSVVGFDDIPEAQIVRPKLTTITQPGFEKGRQASQLLLEMLAGNDVPPTSSFPYRLTLRDSTCPPRGSAHRKMPNS